MNILIQYIIVGLVLLGAVIYIVRKIVALRKHERRNACCGCALSDKCNKKQPQKDCHENN